MVTVRIQSAIPSQACLSESAAGRPLGSTPGSAPGELSACFMDAALQVYTSPNAAPQLLTARLYPQSLGTGTGNVRYFYPNVRTVPGLMTTYFNPVIVAERQQLVQTSARFTYEIQLAQGLPALRAAMSSRPANGNPPVSIPDEQYNALVPELLNYLGLVGEGRDEREQAFQERLFAGNLYSPGSLELVSIAAAGGIQDHNQPVLPADAAGQTQARNLTTLSVLFRQFRHSLGQVPIPAGNEDPTLNTALEYFDSPQGAPVRHWLITLFNYVVGRQNVTEEQLFNEYRSPAVRTALGDLSSRGVSLQGLLMQTGALYLLTGSYFRVSQPSAPRLSPTETQRFQSVMQRIQRIIFVREIEETKVSGAFNQALAGSADGNTLDWSLHPTLTILHQSFPEFFTTFPNNTDPFGPNVPANEGRLTFVRQTLNEVFNALTIDLTHTPPRVSVDLTSLRRSFMAPSDFPQARAIRYLVMLTLFGGRGQNRRGERGAEQALPLVNDIDFSSYGFTNRIQLVYTPLTQALFDLYRDLEHPPRAVVTPHPRGEYQAPPAGYTWSLRTGGLVGLGLGLGSFGVEGNPDLQQGLRATGFTLFGAGAVAELCELGGRIAGRTPPTWMRITCPIVGAVIGFASSFAFDNNPAPQAPPPPSNTNPEPPLVIHNPPVVTDGGVP